MKKTIQIPAELVGFNPLKDGSVNLRFNTQEMSSEEKIILIDLMQKDNFGYLLYKENEFKDSEVPKEDAKYYDEKKSLSTSQREVLWLIWQNKGSIGDFNTYYKQYMLKNIKKLKEYLPPRN